VVDDPVELLALLVEDAAALEELEDADVVEEPAVPEELAVLEAGAVGAVGWKLEFVVPKPMFDAKRPPTVIESVTLSPVRTSWPLPLSVAFTCALP
jgi:hypothetical protein